MCFQQRIVSVMTDIAARHPAKHVLVVTHGGVLDCVQRWARGLALDTARDFDIPNASINQVAVIDGQCDISNWAETEHLTA